MLTQIGLVALGSALGGLARWGIGLAVARWLNVVAFPYHTLAINVTGSLFLGWFLTRLQRTGPMIAWLGPDDLRLLVAVGFTGAYTTFSTFEYETHRLLILGHDLAGLAYVSLSVFLGLLAVHVGVLLAR